MDKSNLFLTIVGILLLILIIFVATNKSVREFEYNAKYEDLVRKTVEQVLDERGYR